MGKNADILQPDLHEVLCWFDRSDFSSNVSCFYMVATEDPDDNSSNHIAFPVIKFVSKTQLSNGDPIVFLGGGGPGGSAGLIHIDGMSDYDDLAAISGRDVYAIDVRGTGMAYPKLKCNHLNETTAGMAIVANELERHERMLDDLGMCKLQMLEAGHNLSHYNSLAISRDVNKLRIAIGVRKWILAGHSYSARYALTVARDYPLSVESMMLIGAGGFSGHNLLDTVPETWHLGFEKAFIWCQENIEKCKTESLQERFQSLVDDLNDDPLHLIPRGGTNNPLEYFSLEKFVLTGDRLVRVVFNNLYDENFFEKFPQLVTELEKGRTDMLMNSLETYLFAEIETNQFSIPVQMSHVCSEILPFSDYLRFMRAVQRTPRFIQQLYSSFTEEDIHRICRIWDVDPAQSLENELVVTSIPTLFLHGANDPVVSIEHLQNQLPNFSDYELLLFEDASHWGSVFGLCAKRAAAYYFNHKKLEEKHHICDYND